MFKRLNIVSNDPRDLIETLIKIETLINKEIPAELSALVEIDNQKYIMYTICISGYQSQLYIAKVMNGHAVADMEFKYRNCGEDALLPPTMKITKIEEDFVICDLIEKIAENN